MTEHRNIYDRLVDMIWSNHYFFFFKASYFKRNAASPANATAKSARGPYVSTDKSKKNSLAG